MRIKISIVVPVYNIQKYITECIESIINQVEKPYEVILVDDGSTDECGRICDYYVEKYDYFKVVHQKNAGLSAARNAGMNVVTGNYVVFVDGDDYISKDTINIYKNKIKENDFPDILIDAGQYTIDNNTIRYTEKYDVESFKYTNGRDVFKEFLRNNDLPIYAAFGKCIRVAFWKENGFCFRNIKSEDLDLMYKVVYNAKKVCLCKGTYYYRNGRVGSIMSTADLTYYKNIVNIIDGWKKFSLTNNLDREDYENLMSLLATILISCSICLYYKMEKNDRIECRKELKEIKYCIELCKYKPFIAVKIIYKYLGAYAASIYFITMNKVKAVLGNRNSFEQDNKIEKGVSL